MKPLRVISSRHFKEQLHYLSTVHSHRTELTSQLCWRHGNDKWFCLVQHWLTSFTKDWSQVSLGIYCIIVSVIWEICRHSFRSPVFTSCLWRLWTLILELTSRKPRCQNIKDLEYYFAIARWDLKLKYVQLFLCYGCKSARSVSWQVTFLYEKIMVVGHDVNKRFTFTSLFKTCQACYIICFDKGIHVGLLCSCK